MLIKEIVTLCENAKENFYYETGQIRQEHLTSFRDSEMIKTQKQQQYLQAASRLSWQYEIELFKNIESLLQRDCGSLLAPINAHYALYTGQSLVEFLISLNWWSVFKLLVDKDLIDSNQRTRDGKTPLMLMCEINEHQLEHIHLEIVQLLLKHGAKINATTEIGETALYYVIKGRTQIHWNIINLLLKYNADPNIQIPLSTQTDHRTCAGTPLHWAARYGSLEIVKLLVDYGAKVDSKIQGVENGETPLDCAVYNPDPKVLNYLTEQNVFARAPSLLSRL